MGLVGTAHSATNTVTSLADNGPGSFRQVIQNSAPGDSIIFSITGTIVLTNGELAVAKNLTIRGPGASALAISGNHLSRVLNVSQSVNVFLSDLTICNGQAAYGTTNNPGQSGGGIYNAGTLSVSNCIVLGNTAGHGGSSGGFGGDRGGIYNLGTLNFVASTISGNSAGYGGITADGGDGGGVYLGGAGQCVVSNCVFSNNYAGSGGGGYSDGKYNGGTGALGGNGGGISCHNAGTLVINCTFANNQAGYGGGGGYGQVSPGKGNTGGWGGGVYASANLTMSGCTVVSNSAGTGGTGGSPGPTGYMGNSGSGGCGGGICTGGLLLTNCTIVGNSGGKLGYSNGGGGNGGNGGGIYVFFTNNTIVACTIVSNSAGSGGVIPWGGTNGIGGGICSAAVGGPVLLNDIVVLNIGDSPDVAGAFQSHGYNLIGVDSSSSGFSAPGDLVGLNPKLGPLADNGGPTLTMALLPGSPAIDAGSAVGAPAADQRGVPRPQGAGVDIGAFECLDSPIFMGATFQGATNCQMQLCGLTPNPALTLQVSTNLLNWWDATNFLAGSNGVFQCVDPIPGGAPARFYRLKSGTP